MKKRAIARAISLFLAGVTVLSLAGCKKQKGNDSVAAQAKANAKNAVFHMDKSLDISFANPAARCNDNGFIFFDGENGTFSFVAGDKAGNLQDVKSYKLSNDISETQPMNVTYSNDGTIYLLDEYCNYDDNIYQYTLVHIAADGSEIAKQDLKENRPYQLEATADGNVVARFENDLVLYDAQLNEKSRLTNQNAAVSWNNVIADGEDILLGYYDGTANNNICKVNFDSKTLGDKIPCPNTVETIVSGKGYDFYMSNGTSFQGVDLASNTATEVLNLMDSDIDITDNPTVIMLDKETALIYTSSYATNKYAGIFKKVPPSQVADKEIFTLGGFFIAPDVKKQIMKFNSENSKYRIKVIDYGEYNTQDTDYKGGYTVFKSDVAAGNIPDIMLTMNMNDIQGYMRKGLFADMTPLMQNAGVNKSDYLDNVIAAGSQNGKLYIIMPFFCVRGYTLKNSNLNGNGGLSVDDYMALEKKYNNAGKSIWYFSKEQVIKNAILYNTSDYMDLETGKCNFDSDDFKKILELANEFAAQDDQDAMNNNYQDVDYLSSGISNRMLLNVTMMSSFRETYRMEQSYFAEDCSFIGFPDLQGNSKPVISPIVSVAISSKCKNKDGAFEFVKSYISPEAQKSVDNGMMGGVGLPLLKSALNDMAKSSMEPYAYQDTNGEWIPVPPDQDTYQRGGKTYSYEPITQDRIDYYMSVITSTDKLEYTEDKILSIINEETAPYFAGQKSVDDVAKIIQSRVSIYVNESQ